MFQLSHGTVNTKSQKKNVWLKRMNKMKKYDKKQKNKVIEYREKENVHHS